MIFGKKTVYNFYKNKTAPSTDALFEKLKEISAGINYEFAYGRTNTLHHLLKKFIISNIKKPIIKTFLCKPQG